jgi:hypothetical protein
MSEDVQIEFEWEELDDRDKGNIIASLLENLKLKAVKTKVYVDDGNIFTWDYSVEKIIEEKSTYIDTVYAVGILNDVNDDSSYGMIYGPKESKDEVLEYWPYHATSNPIHLIEFERHSEPGPPIFKVLYEWDRHNWKSVESNN